MSRKILEEIVTRTVTHCQKESLYPNTDEKCLRSAVEYCAHSHHSIYFGDDENAIENSQKAFQSLDGNRIALFGITLSKINAYKEACSQFPICGVKDIGKGPTVGQICDMAGI